MAHDIMVSYSSKNESIMGKIVEILEKSGFKCWYSKRDIKVGQSYGGEIMKALKSAKAMLLVLSKDFNNSPHTLNEVESAFSFGKLIIPFKMEPFEFNDDFEYFLRRVQSINGFPDLDEALKTLLVQLKELLPDVNQSVDNDSTTINENEYIDILTMAYLDGEVSAQERDMLTKKANTFGLTPERAIELIRTCFYLSAV